MRNVSIISNQIDTLAEKACRLLNKEEKEDFFKTCKDNLKPYYISGVNKGKEREIYEVDGRSFNKIWELTYPYVFTSSNKSAYGNSLYREEIISEVKFGVFRALQLYGPCYHDQKLSQRLKLIVNNVLTNEFNKKGNQIKYEEMLDEDENFEVSDERVSSNSTKFWAEVPFQIRNIVEQLLSGTSLEELKKSFMISETLEKDLLNFARNLSK